LRASFAPSDASISIDLDPKQLRRLLERGDAGMNTLLDLEVVGGGALDGKTVLVRELQKDPVRGRYLHADLYTVDMERAIEVSVPLHISGKAAGIEQGGILDQALREIEIECRPDAIPNEILVDVSALDLGQSLHVRDIELPAGVTLRSDPELSVVSVVAPQKEEEVAVEEVEGEEAEVVEGEAAGEGKEPAPEAGVEDKASD
jgi:large subunit ribosomal protein L25